MAYELPLRLTVNITTPEQLEDWLLVEKTLGPRLPKANASATINLCIGDRAKHIRDQKRDRLDMVTLIKQVKQLVALLERIHGVNLAVTVQQPNGADFKNCDNPSPD